MKNKIIEIGNDPNEIWKNIPGFEGIYQVSNRGRVKSLKRFEHRSSGFTRMRREKIKVTSVNYLGYSEIQLTNKSGRKTFRVHRLVASVFIPNPRMEREVNHINGIKTDNNVANLEWVSRSENILHSVSCLGNNHGCKGIKNIRAKLNDDNVLEIRNSSEGINELAQTFKVTPKTILGIVNKRSWKHLLSPFIFLLMISCSKENIIVKHTGPYALTAKLSVNPTPLTLYYDVFVSNKPNDPVGLWVGRVEKNGPFTFGFDAPTVCNVTIQNGQKVYGSTRETIYGNVRMEMDFGRVVIKVL